jgi:hypothetical protein
MTFRQTCGIKYIYKARYSDYDNVGTLSWGCKRRRINAHLLRACAFVSKPITVVRIFFISRIIIYTTFSVNKCALELVGWLLICSWLLLILFGIGIGDQLILSRRLFDGTNSSCSRRRSSRLLNFSAMLSTILSFVLTP